MRFWIALAGLVLAHAQQAGGLRVEKLNGGPNHIFGDDGFGLHLNKGSSLQRTYYVLNDPSCPVELSGAGITAKSEQGRLGAQFVFVSVGALDVKTPLAAVEVRFILLDVWGRRLKTLSGSDVTDYEAGKKIEIRKQWMASERGVEEYLTSIAFMARARRADGSIWEYDAGKIAAALTGIWRDVEPAGLNPSPVLPPPAPGVRL